ncbi:hypothetical protein Cadr_000021604 [Camelus dromedarius]|uniref:Uncharacterized protein n=1 Tax=Camelus dromedarius TaxID=9838 RepID=A0A5N4CV23_CAMDR|nr:hypothetical protein Cadr_000021604 [Camelus dromedarius]
MHKATDPAVSVTAKGRKLSKRRQQGSRPLSEVRAPLPWAPLAAVTTGCGRNGASPAPGLAVQKTSSSHIHLPAPQGPQVPGEAQPLAGEPRGDPTRTREAEPSQPDRRLNATASGAPRKICRASQLNLLSGRVPASQAQGPRLGWRRGNGLHCGPSSRQLEDSRLTMGQGPPTDLSTTCDPQPRRTLSTGGLERHVGQKQPLTTTVQFLSLTELRAMRTALHPADQLFMSCRDPGWYRKHDQEPHKAHPVSLHSQLRPFPTAEKRSTCTRSARASILDFLATRPVDRRVGEVGGGGEGRGAASLVGSSPTPPGAWQQLGTPCLISCSHFHRGRKGGSEFPTRSVLTTLTRAEYAGGDVSHHVGGLHSRFHRNWFQVTTCKLSTRSTTGYPLPLSCFSAAILRQSLSKRKAVARSTQKQQCLAGQQVEEGPAGFRPPQPAQALPAEESVLARAWGEVQPQDGVRDEEHCSEPAVRGRLCSCEPERHTGSSRHRYYESVNSHFLLSRNEPRATQLEASFGFNVRDEGSVDDTRPTARWQVTEESGLHQAIFPPMLV